MRLIDADELLKKCYNAYPSIDHYCVSRSVVDTKDIINAPTVDAEIVRHGHWIEEDGVQICSNCGAEHCWDEYRASYCDECGAKMDEVEHEYPEQSS